MVEYSFPMLLKGLLFPLNVFQQKSPFSEVNCPVGDHPCSKEEEKKGSQTKAHFPSLIFKHDQQRIHKPYYEPTDDQRSPHRQRGAPG
jgi:hypothetical protein